MNTETTNKKTFAGKHRELWKFFKFLMASGGSSAIEVIIHMFLLNAVFAHLTEAAITNPTLQMLGITSQGYLYTYMISTAVGYAIAFILNRKITFKADANPTLSMVLYLIMVVFTVFANGWIGSAMTTFARAHGLVGGFWDVLIKIIVVVLPILWTYPCNRFIIHRRKKPENEPQEE